MTLRNAFDSLAVETTQQEILSELQTQQKNSLTNSELRASPVPVTTGLQQPTTPTDVQPISATNLPLPTGAATAAKQLPDNHNVTVSNFPAVQTITGIVSLDEPSLIALENVTINIETGASLRVNNTINDPIPVNGTVNIQDNGGSITVDGPLTNAELRASPINVSTGLQQPTTPTDTQPVSAVSLPLPTGAATAANQLPDNHNVTVSNHPASQSVVGSGSANVAQRVHLSDESLSALENINVTVLNTNLEISNDVGNPVPVAGSLSVSNLPSTISGILPSGRPDLTVDGIVSGTGSVMLNVAGFGSLSSFSFEALGFTTGTFVIERTLAADPTSGSAFWTAIGAFKAGTRRAGSTWVNEPGAYHGNLSASTAVRIRFTVAPNTTASVRILGSIGTGTITIGAIANNPDNIIGAVADLGQYYASSFGGRVIFNASTGDSTGLTGTTVNNIAWLRNPAGSGVDLFVYRIFLGASAVVKFRRYRGGSPAVSGSPTPPTRFNRGGGANTSQGILYKQGQFTYTPLAENLSKVSYVPANGTDTDPVNGSIVLRPGESAVWTVAGTSALGGYEASIEVVWWEQTAAN